MAHNIFNSAMAFVGATPWHGIGTKLPETCTWGDVRDAVGFPMALEVPVYAHGLPTPVEGYKALKASDDGRIFSIVGADYGVVQADDFASAIMEAAQAFGVKWSTAGMLGKHGERFFLFGELGDPFKVIGDSSEVRKYFGATSGHDGQTKAHLFSCGTRVVCANTWTEAHGESGNWKSGIRHTSNAADRVKQAAAEFGALAQSFKASEELANMLARTPFSADQLRESIDRVLPLPEKANARNLPAIMADRQKVEELAEAGTGMAGIRGTAWGAFQSFTEWADHHRTVRAQKEIDQLQARALNLTFGPAAEDKSKALAAIRDIASV